MIIETIILKSKVTKLEVVAHYNGDFNYGLSIGESCYSVAIEYNGNEYVICINKDYKSVYGIAEFLTEMIKFPFIVNRITRNRLGYETIRDSVCVGAYNKIMQRDIKNTDIGRDVDSFISSSDELFSPCEIDFDLTDKNWDIKK